MDGAVAGCLQECLWVCNTLKLYQDVTACSQVEAKPRTVQPFVQPLEEVLAELKVHL